jgi:SNF2 family DNA or RNA helicase
MRLVGTSRFPDGSETESDDEPPISATSVTGSNPYSQNELLETRPAFRLGPSQQRLGPLVLDKRKHIQVPSAINTFLRDYQRDGVKFLYDKFKNSMGGMLGDDMGLVGAIWNSAQMKRMAFGGLIGFIFA